MNNLAPLMTSARTGEVNRDEWRTPLWLYERLDEEFHFNLDPAATEENALCEWYFDKGQDGLTSQWQQSSVFINPPYSQLKKWVQKGFEEARDNPSVRQVVMLVPARTDTKAWWDFIRFGQVRFLPGRLKFQLSTADREIVAAKNLDRIAAGRPTLEPERTSAPFPSAVVVFSRAFPSQPQTLYWNLREPTHASSI